MTQLAGASRIYLRIALVLSLVVLCACSVRSQQEAPTNTATPVVIEKIVEAQKVVERVVEVPVPATPVVIEKVVVKEVEVPVEVIREVLVVVTATPTSTSVPTAVPTAQTQVPTPAISAPDPIPVATAEPQNVLLRIVAINDFHGNIATSSSAFGGVGRVDYLAANVASARAEVVHSVFVSAGDLIGGSPLVSALFHDEPTIEAMNLMGLDINAVGNHGFDEGPKELARMQRGGTHPTDGDLDGDPFGGADFRFLAANVVDDATGNTVFPPFAIRENGGIRVAFIGLTLEGTANIVARSSVEGLTFADEAETVNALVPELRNKGIEAVVVLLHQGGFSDGDQNDCGSGLEGAVAEVTARLDDAVDLVIAGHTNDEFVCENDGKWVTMADNAGRLFTVIDAVLDGESRDLVIKSIKNLPNAQEGVTPDAQLTALIENMNRCRRPEQTP